MSARRGPFRRSEAGSIVAEFAIVAPLVILVLGGLLWFGASSGYSARARSAMTLAADQLAHGVNTELVTAALARQGFEFARITRSEFEVCVQVVAARRIPAAFWVVNESNPNNAVISSCAGVTP